MNTLNSQNYIKSIKAKILYLISFWVANHFLLIGAYPEKKDWALDRILISIGMTTLFFIGLGLFIYFQSFLGIMIGGFAAIIGLLAFAYIADKIAEILHIDIDLIVYTMSILSILFSITTFIRLITNIHDYFIIRHAETHGYFDTEE
ncbi:MAG: hypothetical protein IJO85_06795 [Lachnospiraceae bacterium]|nr:hypothetical protein [Lachnospiraceae bacterium]